jgi:antitoxin (DNA-binding transcriptional repressor) of toxin-antitoxin stability system
MSQAYEVSPDDTAGVAEGIRLAAAGSVVHLVQDGRALADIVPAGRQHPARTDPGPEDDAELGSAELAELEQRVAQEPPECAAAGAYHAALFGAPTLAHYRAVYDQAGAPWPGEAFIRRHYLVADAS